jgi:hypothetical protein
VGKTRKQTSSGHSTQDGRRNKTRREMKQRNKNWGGWGVEGVVKNRKRTEVIVLRSDTGNGRGAHGSDPDTVLLLLLVCYAPWRVPISTFPSHAAPLATPPPKKNNTDYATRPTWRSSELSQHAKKRQHLYLIRQLNAVISSHKEKSNKMQPCIKFYYSIICAWQRPPTTRPTTFHVWKTRGCQCRFRLLMMGGMSPETCWASCNYRIIKYDTFLHLVGFDMDMSYARVVRTASLTSYPVRCKILHQCTPSLS